MNTDELINSTLIYIAEFREQFEEMPGATELLDDYAWHLKQGLAQGETLTRDDRRRLLASSNEVSGLDRGGMGQMRSRVGKSSTAANR